MHKASYPSLSSNDPLPAPVKLVGPKLAEFLRDKKTPILTAKMAISQAGYTVTIRNTTPPQLCVENIPRGKIIGRGGGNQPTTCISWDI